MRNSLKNTLKKTVGYSVLTLICVIPSLNYADNLVQVGRYTSTQIGPTQAEINPLDAVAAFRFPSQIRTIGQALEVVLQNTGFQLASKQALSADVKATLRMPLPITNRVLGLMTIKDVISVLMGHDVYQLKVNLLTRTINFEVEPRYRPKIHHAIHHKTEHKKIAKKHNPVKGVHHEFI